MDIEGAREVLRSQHRAVMATRRRNGSVQLSPVLVVLDDEGRPVVSSRQAAMKTKNLRRDPWASLCVINDAFFGTWAQVDGPVGIIELPEALELLVDYYRALSGEHPDWDEYRQAMVEHKRVILRMTIEQAGPSAAG
ncbi:MAG: PPOX class F420-dependent oxidoreductase [Acidimicrobiales bacterium]